MASGGLSSTVGRHMSNPYKNISQPEIRGTPSKDKMDPYSPQLGRHGSNPNAQKNLQYMKNIQKPMRNPEDDSYQFEPVFIKQLEDYQPEMRRGSAMTQVNSGMPTSPDMSQEKRGNMAVYQSQQ